LPDYPKQLAALAVHVGADMQPGQDVIVTAWDPVQAPLVRAIAEEAYASGARYVSALYWDGPVKASRLRHAPEDSLGFVPDWFRRTVTEAIERRAAAISLTGDPDPGVFADVDQERLGRDQMPYIPETFDLIASGDVNWTVVPGPNPGWAARLFGVPDEERLWQALAPILRLDADDPVQAWREHVARLEGRALALNERDFSAVRFMGPGTDLTVGLIPGHRWLGGVFPTTWGPVAVVNLPTEEVFTTPDPERTNGTVTSTKPLVLTDGTVVRDLVVRFEAGRAVEVSASQGGETLRTLTQTDPGAARLGECALVDREGRIGELGTVFYDTLLDENAASHIALGEGFAFLLDEDERQRCNESEIHIDFMVGSDDLTVTGIAEGGERVPVLAQGHWQD
jgi:aminopeptidase